MVLIDWWHVPRAPHFVVTFNAQNKMKRIVWQIATNCRCNECMRTFFFPFLFNMNCIAFNARPYHDQMINAKTVWDRGLEDNRRWERSLLIYLNLMWLLCSMSNAHVRQFVSINRWQTRMSRENVNCDKMIQIRRFHLPRMGYKR